MRTQNFMFIIMLIQNIPESKIFESCLNFWSHSSSWLSTPMNHDTALTPFFVPNFCHIYAGSSFLDVVEMAGLFWLENY